MKQQVSQCLTDPGLHQSGHAPLPGQRRQVGATDGQASRAPSTWLVANRAKGSMRGLLFGLRQPGWKGRIGGLMFWSFADLQITGPCTQCKQGHAQNNANTKMIR